MSRSSRGYSLIEVLIAIAIMGSVFLSIVSLFYLGRRTVYSGKQMTQAIAVGTHVLEDLSHLTVGSVYNSFGVTSTTALGNYTINNVIYNNAILRSTNPTVVGNPPADISAETDPAPSDPNINGFLTTWKNEMENNNKLQDGWVTLVMTPTNPSSPIVNAQGFPEATVLQIRAIVQWREATRPRSLILDTAKIRRPSS